MKQFTFLIFSFKILVTWFLTVTTYVLYEKEAWVQQFIQVFITWNWIYFK